MLRLKTLLVTGMAALVAGFVPGDEAISNWPAPATWSPHSASRGASTMGAVTSPLPFIGLAPCRIVDTRGNGAPIQGGMFTGGSDVRNYPVAGICGIPASAEALSLNFTITGPGQTAPGFLTAWPTNGAVPPVSILNWDHVPAQIANAAVVPPNGPPSVSFTVNVSAPTHVIIDINGYYGSPTADTSNVFLGAAAGNSTMTGFFNTGIGLAALANNTTGYYNTATGFNTLPANTSGTSNTASGHQALFFNSTGNGNTAIGVHALYNNSSGGGNTAIGIDALSLNSTGSGNIAIGVGAGSGTTGDHNIAIGGSGSPGESGTIWIGTPSVQTRAFIFGIRETATGLANAVPVLIDLNGQLGTVSSSRRAKQDIKDMGEASHRLMNLHPVTFRYKAQPYGRTQYGLIAEEVEKVMPELVACSSAGEAETVLYHEMPAMLLNELQKQQREVQKQQREIEELKSELSALRALIGQK